jgi:hypothetical protein
MISHLLAPPVLLRQNHTIEEEVLLGRRRRRRYSVEFKALVGVACEGPRVSLSAIALHHKLNANLRRRRAYSICQGCDNNCVNPTAKLSAKVRASLRFGFQQAK